MGIWQNLTNKVAGRYERGANYELGQSLSSSSVSTLFGHGGDAINVLEEYAGIAWKCIDIRAERLSDQDIFVERLVASKWQEDKLHEFNKVLEGGDSQVDQSEILEAHEKSMCLFGEAFWYFSKGESQNKPFAVYLLNPNSMTVMVAGGKVTGYVYQENGERIALDTDEIAHFKTHDWRHPFRGTGPMQSAGWFIRSSRYTMTFVNNFMENNAIPAGVIVAEDNVSDADWELFKQQWTEKYSGIDKAGKTGFLRNSKVRFEKTGLSLGEIDFDKIKKSNREDIMVMFGISKPMMAIFDDINRASAVTAERLFAKSITAPSLRRIKRKLTKKVATWYGAEFQLGSTNPVPEDDEVKITRLEKGTNKWITVNEARAADGLEPLGPEYDKLIIAPTSSAQLPTKSLGKITIRSNVADEQTKISARDIPDLYDGTGVNPDDLGCVMIDTQKLEIKKYVENADDDLVKATSRHEHAMGAVAEVEPHMTLLYGLLENANVWKDKVDAVLDGWDMKTATIDKVDFFDIPDSYAVIAHIKVTPQLIDGHERLTLLPHIQTYSEYKPHMTLAYIEKTADVKKWVKALGDVYDGKRIKVSGINYGDKPKAKGKSAPVAKNNKADFNYEMKESFRSQMENIQVKYEQQFYQKSNAVLKAQKTMVIDQLQPKKLVAASFDPEGEAKKLADDVLPLFMLLAEEQGNLAAKFAGNADTEFKLTDVMKTYIRNSVSQSALSFSTETQDKIATAIQEGLTAGEAAPKIAKRIDAIYEDLLGVKTPGFRTERLARTEIIKASNEITEAAYKQTGVVQKKEWFANPGHCQFCASLDGSIIKLGATFLAKGQTLEGSDGGTRLNDYEDVKHPPAHSSCRCTLIPVVEGEA